MNDDIQIKLDLLIQELRKSAPKTATCVTIFVNASDATVKWSHRTPETLRAEGVSMRNLAGEFIK